jgi:hypothetical protein
MHPQIVNPCTHKGSAPPRICSSSAIGSEAEVKGEEEKRSAGAAATAWSSSPVALTGREHPSVRGILLCPWIFVATIHMLITLTRFIKKYIAFLSSNKFIKN